jgi:hypothetical protein
VNTALEVASHDQGFRDVVTEVFDEIEKYVRGWAAQQINPYLATPSRHRAARSEPGNREETGGVIKPGIHLGLAAKLSRKPGPPLSKLLSIRLPQRRRPHCQSI